MAHLTTSALNQLVQSAFGYGNRAYQYRKIAIFFPGTYVD